VGFTLLVQPMIKVLGGSENPLSRTPNRNPLFNFTLLDFMDTPIQQGDSGSSIKKLFDEILTTLEGIGSM